MSRTVTNNKIGAKWKTIAQGIITLAAIVALLYYLFSQIFSLEKEIAAQIVGAMATVTAAIITISWTRSNEKQKAIEEHIREQKIPLYEDFMKMAFRSVMTPGPKHPKPTPAEQAEFFRDWLPKMTIWGSSNVLREIVAWKRSVRKSAAYPMETLDNIGKLFLTIRADLGHKDDKLSQRDILALFVNDIDEQPPISNAA